MNNYQAPRFAAGKYKEGIFKAYAAGRTKTDTGVSLLEL